MGHILSFLYSPPSRSKNKCHSVIGRGKKASKCEHLTHTTHVIHCAGMKQLIQTIEDAIAGLNPYLVVEALSIVCASRGVLERDASKARLWRAMATALKRARTRWASGVKGQLGEQATGQEGVHCDTFTDPADKGQEVDND